MCNDYYEKLSVRKINNITNKINLKIYDIMDIGW